MWCLFCVSHPKFRNIIIKVWMFLTYTVFHLLHNTNRFFEKFSFLNWSFTRLESKKKRHLLLFPPEFHVQIQSNISILHTQKLTSLLQMFDVSQTLMMPLLSFFLLSISVFLFLHLLTVLLYVFRLWVEKPILWCDQRASGGSHCGRSVHTGR